MELRDASRVVKDGLEIDVLVSPRSNRSGSEGFDEWRKRLILRIKSPPLDGKANKEVETMIKEMSGCSSRIISGHLNRQKTVLIHGDGEKILSVMEGKI
jgi:uncharacterized protein